MSETTSEPVIFSKLSDWYLTAHTRILTFPKVSRYSLGAQIGTSILEIIELSYLAGAKRGRSRLLILEKVDIKLRVHFTMLRLAWKTKCLSDAGYAEISERGIEIGRMVGGWIKKTKTAQNNSARPC